VLRCDGDTRAPQQPWRRTRAPRVCNQASMATLGTRGDSRLPSGDAQHAEAH
jgi:hypothetical protein